MIPGWNNGILEYWSVGFYSFLSITPALQYSIKSVKSIHSVIIEKSRRSGELNLVLTPIFPKEHAV